MIIVVVFDTNVLFSGLRWKGPPYQLLQHAREGRIRIVTCAQLLDELVEILVRKVDYTEAEANERIQEDLGFLNIIDVPGRIHGLSPDPDDDIVLECAVAAEASYIVTGDKRHLLSLQSYQGIPIVSPAAFLEQLAAMAAEPPPS